MHAERAVILPYGAWCGPPRVCLFQGETVGGTQGEMVSQLHSLTPTAALPAAAASQFETPQQHGSSFHGLGSAGHAGTLVPQRGFV